MNNFLLKIKNLYKKNHETTQETICKSDNESSLNSNSLKRFNRIIITDLILLLALFLVVPIIVFAIYYMTYNSNIAIYFTNIHKNSQNFTTTTTTLMLDLNNGLQGSKNDIVTVKNKNNLHKFDKIEVFNEQLMRPMKKYYVQNKATVCNDGSAAGYYLRQSNTKSQTWIIVLEGGNFCNNDESCYLRSFNTPKFTSSINWPPYRYDSGILSNKKSDNKYLWNANAVIIPYCSSDLWLGNKRAQTNTRNSFNFMGRQILNDAINDLINLHQMSDSKTIILTGMSAGGIGVMMNIDEINENLKIRLPNVELKGILDSSWLLDIPCGTSQDQSNCSISEQFFKTFKYWNASIPLKYIEPFDKPWYSLLPNKIYSLIKTPLFILQSLYDETQLLQQYNILANSNKRHIQPHPIVRFVRTIRMLKAKMSKTFKNAQSYFVPACMSHMILLNKNWYKIHIGSNYLDDVLNCWIINKTGKCAIERVIDTCTFPNCNKACTNPSDPLNENDISNPLELFRFYNLVNYKDLSTYLHINENNLANYSYDELMNRLMTPRKRL